MMADIRMLQEQTALLRGAAERAERHAEDRRLEARRPGGRVAQGLRRSEAAGRHHLERPPRRPREGRRQQRPHQFAVAGTRGRPADDPAGVGAAPAGRRRRRGHCRARRQAWRAGPAAGRRRRRPGVSPQRLYDLAWGDYVGAQYNLAISGFENYIRTFPGPSRPATRSTSSARATTSRGCTARRSTAFDRGISDYPNSKRIPDMYFKRGMALNALGQTDRARESWEYVVKTFPNSDAGRLARQRLDQLIRKDAVTDAQDEPDARSPGS